jgi:hypothetical protein
MDHIGIDVHKKESQICILTEGGRPRRVRWVEQAQVREDLAHQGRVLHGRPRRRRVLMLLTLKVVLDKHSINMEQEKHGKKKESAIDRRPEGDTHSDPTRSHPAPRCLEAR